MELTQFYKAIPSILIFGALLFYFYRSRIFKNNIYDRKVESTVPETGRPGTSGSGISLTCYNLNFLQYVFGTGLWLGSALFLSISLGEFHVMDDGITEKVVDSITNGYTMAVVYLGMLASIFYI